MVKKNLLQLSLLAGTLLLSALQVTAAETGSKTAPAAETSKQLLFFMNPNGYPCRMQDAILRNMGESLTGIAEVKYYKTTVRADHPVFGSYGIRGLPLLIILDAKGNEEKRFTPGVQDAETILSALREKK